MTLEEAIAMSTQNDRVCPQPSPWTAIHRRLAKVPVLGDKLPLPLILGGWHYSSDQEKQSRFHLHLAFADQHGLMEFVAQRMNEMAESDWHHRGE